MYCYTHVCRNRSHHFQGSQHAIGWERMIGTVLKKRGRRRFLSGKSLQQILTVERISGGTQTSDVVCVKMLQKLMRRQKNIVTIEVSDEMDLQSSLVKEIAAFTYGLKLEAEKVCKYISCNICDSRPFPISI